MFTGLVEEVGKLLKVQQQGESMCIEIEASTVMSDIQLGDSIAVNGVCLTVTSFTKQSFYADVMPETFRKSTLSDLPAGSRLNLERAMLPTTRFGGHIVQGHVDSTGIIVNIKQDYNAVRLKVRMIEQEQLKYVIPKGSITLDGVSLTVIDVIEDCFEVSIIPHTYSETALKHRKLGESINIECDIIGKYVEHLLGYRDQQFGKAKQSKLSSAFLADHGFM